MDANTETNTHDQDSTPSSVTGPSQFRLRYVVYVVTLLCTSLLAFDTVGFLWTIAATVFWGCVLLSSSRPKALAIACLVTISAVCLGVFFSPADGSSREAPRPMQCSNHVKQIALALQNYMDVHGTYPPAFVPDDHGKPKHSWRVLLLPFMECQRLYDQYDFDEPWDGPNNRKLAAIMPNGYACPSASRSATHPDHSTDYLAVVGKETAWPGAKGRRKSEFGDPASTTILVFEALESPIPWMEPRDLSLDEAIRLVTSADSASGHGRDGLLFNPSGGRHAGFADGSVHLLRHGVARGTWRAMFTIDGGEVLSDEDVNATAGGGEKWRKIGQRVGLAAFSLMLLLPLPWVWLNPSPAVIS